MVNEERQYFLDGIRGWAALMVLFFHLFFSLPINNNISYIFSHIFLFNGSLAVWIFFIISGFSLSIKYCYQRENKILIKIFLGRYLRLGIPILIFSLLIIFLYWLGLFPAVSHRPPSYTIFLKKQYSIYEAIRFAFYRVFFPSSNEDLLIIPPAWTIEIEFLGSLITLCTLILVGQWFLRFGIYFLLVVFFYFFCSSPFSLYYLGFLEGIIFAEIYSSQLFLNIKNKVSSSIFLLLIPAIYLTTNPRITGLSKYYFMTASLFCFCFIFNHHLRSFFSTKMSLFLGKISYTLYLTHATILYIFTINMNNIFNTWTGEKNLIKLMIDILTIIICIFTSYLLSPLDQISIKIARKFSNYSFKILFWLKNSKLSGIRYFLLKNKY